MMEANFEPELILIPAGEFLMGSDPEIDGHTSDKEQPQHRLSLAAFYLARTPVTNAQYAAFMDASHHRPVHGRGWSAPPGKEDHPVVNVTWDDAVAYCVWLSGVTGRRYRLPSEAEWEKGARGLDGRIWPWGDDRPDATRGNFGARIMMTTPVGAYPAGASPFGLLDMAGNVWEWTRSLLEGYPYPSGEEGRSERESLEAPDREALRVLRGGSFEEDAGDVRCAARGAMVASYFGPAFGFRVAMFP